MKELLFNIKARMRAYQERKAQQVLHPFWVVVQKEVSDHVKSWRFIILLSIIALTCLGALYTSTMTIRQSLELEELYEGFFFLKLFTLSDGTMPSLISFVAFLGPLLGIGLGFDAVNSERIKGTLSRIMSQPIHRDYLLNAKFTAALIIISFMFASLTFLVTGFGLWMLGIPPSPDEFLRMLLFLIVAIFYVGFWLNLSILFSVRFRQPATSALSSIAIWLFFSVFYTMIVNLTSNLIQPAQGATREQIMGHHGFISLLTRLSPGQLFNEATTTLLMPSVRTLSPFVNQEQLIGFIPTPLSVGQSLLLIWPHVTSLMAATIICFALSYVIFMKQEIRSRL